MKNSNNIPANFKLASQFLEVELKEEHIFTLRERERDLAKELMNLPTSYVERNVQLDDRYISKEIIAQSFEQPTVLVADPGTGKTSGICDYVHESAQGTSLLVVPTKALAKAVSQQYGVLRNREIPVITTVRDLKKLVTSDYSLVVMNYEAFAAALGMMDPTHARYPLEIVFNRIIIDEIHKIITDFKFRPKTMATMLDFISRPYTGLLLMTGTLSNTIKRVFKSYTRINVIREAAPCKITLRSVSLSNEIATAIQTGKRVSRAVLKDTHLVEHISSIDPRATAVILNYSSNKRTFRLADSLDFAPVNAIAIDLADAGEENFEYMDEVVAGTKLSKHRGVIGSSVIEQGINIPLYDPEFPHAEIIVITSSASFIDRSSLIQAAARVRAATTATITLISSDDQKTHPHKNPLIARHDLRPFWLRQLQGLNIDSKLTILKYLLESENNHNCQEFYEPLIEELNWTVEHVDKIYSAESPKIKLSESNLERKLNEGVDFKAQLFAKYVENDLKSKEAILSRDTFLAAFQYKTPTLPEATATQTNTTDAEITAKIRPLLGATLAMTLKRNVDLWSDFHLETVATPTNSEYVAVRALQKRPKKKSATSGSLEGLTLTQYNRLVGEYYAQWLWKSYPDDVSKLAELFIGQEEGGIFPIEELQAKKFTKDTKFSRLNMLSKPVKSLLSGLPSRALQLAVLDALLLSVKSSNTQGNRYYVAFKPYCPLLLNRQVTIDFDTPEFLYGVQFEQQLAANEIVLTEEEVLESTVKLTPIVDEQDVKLSIRELPRDNRSNAELKDIAKLQSNRFDNALVSNWVNVKSSVLLNDITDDFWIFCPFTFKNNYRKIENIASKATMLVFDVDKTTESMTDLHNRLTTLNVDHVLLTTSNSSNEFKYRLFIPSAREISVKEYKYVIKEASAFLGITADPLPGSQVMFLYPDSIKLSHEGQALIVPELLIVTKLATQGKVVARKAHAQRTETTMTEPAAEATHLTIARKYIKRLENTPVGERNIALASFLGKMKYQKFTFATAEYVFRSAFDTWGVDFETDRAFNMLQRFYA